MIVAAAVVVAVVVESAFVAFGVVESVFAASGEDSTLSGKPEHQVVSLLV